MTDSWKKNLRYLRTIIDCVFGECPFEVQTFGINKTWEYRPVLSVSSLLLFLLIELLYN